MKYTKMSVRKIGYNERPYMEQVLGCFCNGCQSWAVIYFMKVSQMKTKVKKD